MCSGEGVLDSVFSLYLRINRRLAVEPIFGDRLGVICKEGSFTSSLESSSFSRFYSFDLKVSRVCESLYVLSADFFFLSFMPSIKITLLIGAGIRTESGSGS